MTLAEQAQVIPDIRTQAMDALLERIERVCTKTFLHYSRRFLTWEDMLQKLQSGTTSPAPKQPALYLFDGVGLGGGTDTVAQRSRGLPPVITMNRTIVIYAQFPGGGKPGGIDDTTPGGGVFYPLINSLESAMAPDDAQQNALTLDGLVSHCWIEGDIHFVTGEIDPQGQGMMVVPVKIMLLPVLRKAF